MKTLPYIRHSLMICAVLATGQLHAAAPVIDCRKPPAGSMEALVCGDAELMALDRVMATVYAAAVKKAGRERPPLLKAEQRGWIKGRNDCWKSDDKRACVVDSYRRRIVELQARYRLVTASAPVRYVCNGNPADEVVATYFQTDPPSLIAERGDSSSLMYQAPSASGARYLGRNELLWEHQGKATIRWGYQAPEMPCVVADESGRQATTLAGTRWRLRAMQSMDDRQGVTRVADPQRYTLEFSPDGRAALRLDCNRATGSWKATAATAAAGSLEFGALATTRALCAPGSLDQALARQLPYVRSYLLRDGKLYLSLLADGGILEWERAE
jgi:uncharacterized protein/heat shock protein HslJ